MYAIENSRAAERMSRPAFAFGAYAGRTGAGASLSHAFERTGGVLDATLLCEALRERCGQPVSVLAHWIVGHHVVSFSDRGELLLPMFQFERPSLSLRAALREVIAALLGAAEARDDESIARWFAEAQAGLGGRSPAEALTETRCDVARLCDAARAACIG